MFCIKDDTTQQLITCSHFIVDASGLLKCLGEALEPFGVENVLDKDNVLAVQVKPTLVGIGTDDATVNIGENNGLKGQIQRALPWVFWGWCYAHWLELACKDAFSSSLFSSVQEMLLRLYYLYEKSPEKYRELEYISKERELAFEGGNCPIRSFGTRWIKTPGSTACSGSLWYSHSPSFYSSGRFFTQVL